MRPFGNFQTLFLNVWKKITFQEAEEEGIYCHLIDSKKYVRDEVGAESDEDNGYKVVVELQILRTDSLNPPTKEIKWCAGHSTHHH